MSKNKIKYENENNTKSNGNTKNNKVENTSRLNIVSKITEEENTENEESQESKIDKKNSNNNEIKSSEEQEYLSKIENLKKILQSEREKAKLKSQENTSLSFELKQKISSIKKEILTYIKTNDEQREKLTSLNKELNDQINKMNYKNITKKIQKERLKSDQNKFKKNLNANQLIDSSISAKEKQLKNIMSLIDILSKENDNLKQELHNTTNTEKIYELIDEQKLQEQKIISISNEIKVKKTQIVEHAKCSSIKEDLRKKIEDIKIEINRYHEKFVNSKEKLESLENKIKTKSKNMTNEKNNCNQKNNKNNLSKSANILKKGLNEKDNNDDILISSKEKSKRYEVPVQKPINGINEDELVNIPPQLSEIFTERELKAMLIGLDKNKYKYENILKKFNIQNSYIDSLETKHKLDVKQKLNKINELDEQIEFMHIRKGEFNSNVELFKKQIEDTKQEKKIMDMKINQMNNELVERKKIIAKKEDEIKLLGAQLIRYKKLLKKGEMGTINDEPDIKIEKNENENNNGENTNEDAMTQKTGYDDDNVNNIKPQQFNLTANNNNINCDDNNSVDNDEKNNNINSLQLHLSEEDSKDENDSNKSSVKQCNSSEDT